MEDTADANASSIPSSARSASIMTSRSPDRTAAFQSSWTARATTRPAEMADTGVSVAISTQASCREAAVGCFLTRAMSRKAAWVRWSDTSEAIARGKFSTFRLSKTCECRAEIGLST